MTETKHFNRVFERISPNSKTLKGEAHLLNSHAWSLDSPPVLV